MNDIRYCPIVVRYVNVRNLVNKKNAIDCVSDVKTA